MTIRSTIHPTILTSSRFASRGPGNIILEYARDHYDQYDCGTLWSFALEVLEATQWLRMLYDSPRIGGGIDPDVQLVGTFDGARGSNYILEYICGPGDEDDGESVDEVDLGVLEDLDGDYVQDCIVHAEAVSKRLLALAEALAAENGEVLS